MRTLAHIGTEIKQKKWNFSFHFYNEQDMKNQSNQLELNDQNIAFLRQIGNNVIKPIIHISIVLDFKRMK